MRIALLIYKDLRIHGTAMLDLIRNGRLFDDLKMSVIVPVDPDLAAPRIRR